MPFKLSLPIKLAIDLFDSSIFSLNVFNAATEALAIFIIDSWNSEPIG